MGKTIIRRLAVTVLLSILPPAMLLAVLAARGKLSLVVLAVVLGVALIGGIVASAMVVRVLIERKQSLEAAAENLKPTVIRPAWPLVIIWWGYPNSA